MVTEVKILNDSFTMNTDNTWQIVLAVLTLVLLVITFYGIIVTNNNTKKQLIETKRSNDLLLTEIENKFRPFFTLEKFHVTLKGDTKIVLRVYLKNYGTVPARKITAYRTKVLSEKLIELCKIKDGLKESREFGTLQHNGTYYFEEFVEYEKGSKDIFFLIWFEYQYFKKTEESAVLCKIDPSDLDNVKQLWFIQEDIDESRKEWDDFKSGKTGV